MSKIRQAQKVFEILWIFMAVFCTGNAVYDFINSQPKKGFIFLGVALLSLLMFILRRSMRLKQENREKNN